MTNKIRRSLGATLGILTLTTSLVAIAGPADAAPVSPLGVCTGPICGTVYNNSASNSLLKVTSDWGSKAFKWISPGYNSKQAGIKDADGFYVDPGCTAVQVLGPKTPPVKYAVGWHQIHDYEAPSIKITC